MSSQSSPNTSPQKRRTPEPEESHLPVKIRKTRITAAAESGRLEELKSLVTDPDWYSIRDNFGYSLLQTAITRRNKSIFNYLLSIEEYPFGPDDEGVATLKLALSSEFTEYFAIKLIESGADIHAICDEAQNTFLHRVVQMRFINAAEVMIKKGADINAQNVQGCTPLLMLVQHGIFDLFGELCTMDNFVSMFLYYGADVTVCDLRGKTALELALNAGNFDEHVFNILENLIFHTLDEHSDYKLPVDVLFRLFNAANANNPRFRQIVDYLRVLELDIESLQPDDVSFQAAFLFFVDLESLQLLMAKFPRGLSQILRVSSRTTRSLEEYFFMSTTIENFRLMIESDLGSDTIQFIGRICIADLLDERNEAGIIDLIHYLLTYGLPVYEECVEAVYKRFGYSNLFKLLLHMDIEKKYSIQRDIIPAIMYNMSVDIEKFLQDPHNFSLKSICDLLDYSALPKLKTLCYRLNIERLIAKAKGLPKVPRLEELARNASRKSIIKRFNVKTSKEFYTKLKSFKIGENHKKIISFEMKLYIKA